MIQTYRIIKNKTLNIKIIFKNIKNIFATFGSIKFEGNIKEKKYKGKVEGNKKWQKIKNRLKVDKFFFFVTSNSFYLF